MTQNIIRAYDQDDEITTKKQNIPFKNTLQGIYKDLGSLYGFITYIFILIKTWISILISGISSLSSKIESLITAYDKLASDIREVRELPSMFSCSVRVNQAKYIDKQFTRILLFLMPVWVLLIYKIRIQPGMNAAYCQGFDGNGKCIEYQDDYYLMCRMSLLVALMVSSFITIVLYQAYVHPRITITTITAVAIYISSSYFVQLL